MYTIKFKNGQVKTEDQIKWKEITSWIKEITLPLKNGKTLKLSGFWDYLVLKDMESIFGIKGSKQKSYTFLCSYFNKKENKFEVLQITIDCKTGKIVQMLNSFEKPYVRVTFNKDDVTKASPEVINKTLWRTGEVTKSIAELI